MENKNYQGVIYILQNPSFPQYIKIGYATDVNERLRQLNRSECIPFAFRLYATYAVTAPLTDKEVHKIIDRINPNLRTIENFEGRLRIREFYAMSAEDAYSILESMAIINGTPERLVKNEHQIVEEEEVQEKIEQKPIEIQEEPIRKRKNNLDFFELGIPAGAELEYINDPKIKVIVVDNHHVKYEDKTWSLSRLVQELRQDWRAIQGTLYFTYKGENLAKLRLRKELEKKVKYGKE